MGQNPPPPSRLVRCEQSPLPRQPLAVPRECDDEYVYVCESYVYVRFTFHCDAGNLLPSVSLSSLFVPLFYLSVLLFSSPLLFSLCLSSSRSPFQDRFLFPPVSVSFSFPLYVYFTLPRSKRTSQTEPEITNTLYVTPRPCICASCPRCLLVLSRPLAHGESARRVDPLRHCRHELGLHVPHQHLHARSSQVRFVDGIYPSDCNVLPALLL